MRARDDPRPRGRQACACESGSKSEAGAGRWRRVCGRPRRTWWTLWPQRCTQCRAQRHLSLRLRPRAAPSLFQVSLHFLWLPTRLRLGTRSSPVLRVSCCPRFSLPQVCASAFFSALHRREPAWPLCVARHFSCLVCRSGFQAAVVSLRSCGLRKTSTLTRIVFEAEAFKVFQSSHK